MLRVVRRSFQNVSYPLRSACGGQVVLVVEMQIVAFAALAALSQETVPRVFDAFWMLLYVVATMVLC
jgi:hypothetical protein